MLNNNDILAQLQRNKSDVDQQISEAKTKEKQLTEKIGGLKTTIKSYEEQQQSSYQQKEQLAVHLKQCINPILA